MQKQEVREAVELPLSHPELYRQIGIDPPRGVLMYGPPGTGKTMLAKAVANSTSATFISMVGSEFVQKYLGEVRRGASACLDARATARCADAVRGRAREWCAMCSGWRARTRPPLSSSMRCAVSRRATACRTAPR